MMAAYARPFCSSVIFFAAEVLPLKNASQFAVIRAVALAGGRVEGGTLAEDVLELPHAASAATSARPSAGGK